MTNTKSKLNMTTNIKKVLIIGLGGIGSVFATHITDNNTAELKILIDETRWKKYTSQPTNFNGKDYNFNYILPDNTEFKADLVIIATKNNGLSDAIKNIKNFVNENTIIISLLNGIHSEEEIAKVYKKSNILYSFYIGCSCIRKERNITQNGSYNIVIGSKDNNQDILVKKLDDFLTKSDIKHYVSDNILDEYWKKFFINVGINQLSAVTDKTLKEIKQEPLLTERMKKLMKEAELVAEKEGIKNHLELYTSAVNYLLYEQEDSTPSMLQDVRNKKPTEVDIFAGQVIKLAKKHNIDVPENKKVYEHIKNLNLN